MAEGGTGREQPSRGVVAAFVALAVLAGPASSYLFLLFALHWQTHAGEAISYLIAGFGLLLLSLVRRQPMLGAGEWVALLALLFPQWLLMILAAPYVGYLPWLHATPAGATLLLTIAAPLWLGLLSALELVREPVPRNAIGAGIAGVGTVFLVVPLEDLSIRPNQIPVLLMQMLLNILAVWTWVYAARRLRKTSATAAAGSFLLLCALGNWGVWLIFERATMQPLEWSNTTAAALLQDAVVAGCLWWLWFCLLQRMTLAAFAMRPLAMWAAAIVPGHALFGLMNWRIDAALAIAVGAIVVALLARVAEEQPVALGLGAP